MKKFRKIMAVLVATIMIVATMVPAWAASGRFTDDRGKVTLNTTQKDETYEIYKIFDLASFDDTNPAANNHTEDKYAYVIVANSPWLSFFTAADKDSNYEAWGSDFITVDQSKTISINSTDYYPVTAIVTTSGGFQDPVTSGMTDYEKDFTGDALYMHTSQKFARAAAMYADKTDTVTRAKTAITGDGNSQYWDDLDLGYYLVTSSMGTLVALDTTNTEITMYEKNKVATTAKDVQEDSLSTETGETNNGVTAYDSKNDADIGDWVYFRNIVNIGKGALNYVGHDEMSSGLTFDPATVKVYLAKGYQKDTTTLTTMSEVPTSGAVATAANGATTAISSASITKNYEVKTTSLSDENCTFEIVFDQNFMNAVDNMISSDAVANQFSFVITYRARLNQNAVVGEPGNPNTFYLTYGDESETNPETTYTYTWALDLYKYWMNRDTTPTKEGLPGGQFQVAKVAGTPLQFVELSKGKYVYVSDIQGQTLNTPEANTTTDGGGNVKKASELLNYASLNITADNMNNAKIVDTVETDANGVINILGLDGDEYIVSETLAPRGFNKVDDNIYIHIHGVTTPDTGTAGYTHNGSTNGGVLKDGEVMVKGITVASASAKTGTLASATKITTSGNDKVNPNARMLEIENKTTKELPSTGGMGTTVLYIVGGMLIVLAGAYLFFSRKKTA